MQQSKLLISLTLTSITLFLTGCGGSSGGSNNLSPQARLACDNVLAELAMPFYYQATAEGVQIYGQDNTPMHLIFGPWGAHNSPHTGYAYGNSKADMMAVLAYGVDELTTFDGGPCTDYDTESNQPNCGMPQSDLLAKRPVYILPNQFSPATLAEIDEHDIGYRIIEVALKFQGQLGHEDWYYWDSRDQWDVTAEICGYRFSYGHLGSLATPLKEALVERGISETVFDDYNGTLGTNLLIGLGDIHLPPGTAVAYPQLVGQPIPEQGEQTVAYATPHRGPAVIWAQIEFNTMRYDLDSNVGYNVPTYSLLSTTEYSLWQKQLHAEMMNPNSARYSNVPKREWLWRAEGELNHTPEYRFEGTENGLLRELADWWEHASVCGEDKIMCNEVVSFNRIDRHTDVFDDTAYEANSHYIF